MNTLSGIIVSLMFTTFACADYSYMEFLPLFPPTQPWESVCSAKLLSGVPGASLKGCGVHSGSAHDQGVTLPARIKNVEVRLFITNSGDPALKIVFESSSPNSPQSYEVDVSAEMSKPIYCGKIKTPKPGRSQAKHNLAIDMTCSKRKLTPGEQIKISVTPLRGYIKTINYQIPGCTDRRMIKANKCQQLQKQRIQFRLRQLGNGTMVILDIKSAYPQRKVSSTINLMLRLKKEGESLLGWVEVGDVVQLKYPARKYLFENLTPGEQYSVLVWRDSNPYVRNSEKIILRNDIKKRRHAPRHRRDYYYN